MIRAPGVRALRIRKNSSSKLNPNRSWGTRDTGTQYENEVVGLVVLMLVLGLGPWWSLRTNLKPLALALSKHGRFELNHVYIFFDLLTMKTI